MTAKRIALVALAVVVGELLGLVFWTIQNHQYQQSYARCLDSVRSSSSVGLSPTIGNSWLTGACVALSGRDRAAIWTEVVFENIQIIPGNGVPGA